MWWKERKNECRMQRKMFIEWDRERRACNERKSVWLMDFTLVHVVYVNGFAKRKQNFCPQNIQNIYTMQLVAERAHLELWSLFLSIFMTVVYASLLIHLMLCIQMCNDLGVFYSLSLCLRTFIDIQRIENIPIFIFHFRSKSLQIVWLLKSILFFLWIIQNTWELNLWKQL